MLGFFFLIATETEHPMIYPPAPSSQHPTWKIKSLSGGTFNGLGAQVMATVRGGVNARTWWSSRIKKRKNETKQLKLGLTEGLQRGERAVRQLGSFRDWLIKDADHTGRSASSYSLRVTGRRQIEAQRPRQASHGEIVGKQIDGCLHLLTSTRPYGKFSIHFQYIHVIV